MNFKKISLLTLGLCVSLLFLITPVILGSSDGAEKSIYGGIVANNIKKINKAVDSLYNEWSPASMGHDGWYIPEEKYIKEPPYVIGVSHSFLGNAWMRQFHEEIVVEANRYPDLIEDVIFTNAEFSVEKQVSDMNDLMNQGCDIILIDATAPPALNSVVEEAMNRGIAVVTMNNIVTTKNVISSVSTDELMFGVESALWLVNEMNGKGKVLIIRGMEGLTDDEKRWLGAKTVFDQFPDIEVAGIGFAEYSYDVGKKVSRELLAANPSIDGAWSCGGQMMRAFVDTMQELNMPLVPCSGELQNGFLKQIKELKSDGFSGVAPSKPTWESIYALRFALMAVQGQQVPKEFIIPCKVVTEDLIDLWYKPDFSDELWNDTMLTEEKLRELGF